MDPASFLPAMIALAVMVATAWVAIRIFGRPADSGRYAALDGVRGYLSAFVFLHHACVWYFYLYTGKWQLPPSQLYITTGQSCVVFFFMITGFLFHTKILDARARGGVDWGRLYVSRVMRLTPMYLGLVLLVFVVIAVESSGELAVSLPQLLWEAFAWLSYTVFGAPTINDVAHTKVIVSGVTWTLAFEWFFYLSLPLFAWAVGSRPPSFYLLFVLAGLIGFLCWFSMTRHLLGLFAGVLAAYAVRSERFCRFAVTPLAGVVAVACLLTVVFAFDRSYGIVQRALLAATFCLIVGGNTLFGLLRLDTSRMLGDMAYSIYLLHGILLFVMVNYVVGADAFRGQTPQYYWTCVVVLSSVLVLASATTFRYIEKPGMHSTQAVTDWLRAKQAAWRRGGPASDSGRRNNEQ